MYCKVDKYVDPKTFINKVIDNKLGKDDKDKRVNLKCQAFIWWIIYKKLAGLLVDQSVIWKAMCICSASRVNVACL